MWELLRIVVRSAVSALGPRRDLTFENLALRHPLVVLRRSPDKPTIEDRDRLLWIAPKRIWSNWGRVLELVQPATVVKWHRAGFRYYWRRKSRPKGGRPKIDPELHKLIRDMVDVCAGSTAVPLRFHCGAEPAHRALALELRRLVHICSRPQSRGPKTMDE